ncbi:restriction endonuclease subunit S [Streptococcus suis]|nr:restriction endonuclease subunit S [Streptococcus suis]
MNHIEKMLQDYCPNGVEWKELGEVCEIQRGVRITKNQLLPSGYPVVSGGTGYMGYTDNYNREADTITIAQYGTAGYVNIQKEKFWANDVCFSVYPKDILVNKYLYYVLANKQEYLYSISNRTAVPYSISKDKILRIKIPTPPLEIQKEIVALLDKFTEYVTELTAELTAELALRQKQYNYFRDSLLNFDSDSSGGGGRTIKFIRLSGRRLRILQN